VNIRVQYHGFFAQMTRHFEEQLDLPRDASVLDTLKMIGRQYPALAEAIFLAGGEPAPYARPFVNGIMIGPDELAQPLRDGDELALLPALSGGE